MSKAIVAAIGTLAAIAFFGIAISIVGGCKAVYKTKTVSVGSPVTCLVKLFSHLPQEVDRRDEAAVKWDNEIVFSGPLPADDNDMWMPVLFVKIKTNPGPHVLEVRRRGETQRLDVFLIEGQDQCFMILDEGMGKGGLIRALGSNPGFI